MIAEKTYMRPESVQDAVKIAHEYGNSFCYLAGGTDVLTNKYQGTNDKLCLIDITGISALKTVSITEGYLKIGSLVRLDELKSHKIIAHNFPALLIAADEVASPVLRKMATIGGNILCENRCSYFNQSEWWREAVGQCLKCDGDVCIATGGTKACFSRFVSDMAPVLICANARIEVEDLYGIKLMNLESIYTGDGIKSKNLPATSLIRNILLPLGQDYKIVFKKLRPRNAVDFTSLTTAVSVNNNGELKVAVGGVDPKPVVVTGTRQDDMATLIKKALAKSRAVDNDFYSRKYRREMLQLFLEQSIQELSE